MECGTINSNKNVAGDKFEEFITPSLKSRAAKRGGGSNRGVSRSGLVLTFCPLLSFLGLSRFFRDLPDLSRDGPRIFPICPPLSRPINSTYEEQSRKGPRHNPDLSRKSGKPPGLAFKVGLRWVFVNGLKWVQKWVLGAKMGRKWSKPTF